MRRLLVLSLFAPLLLAAASFSAGQDPKKEDKQPENKPDPVEMVEYETETPIALKDQPFDRFVELDMVGEAFREVNASLLADVALQLTEGERVLGRSHKGGVTSRALLDAAAKMAMLRHDEATLKRLAQKAKDRGDDERHADITTKIRLMGKTRSPLDEAAAVKTTPSTQELLKLHFDEMHRQLVIGDPEALQDMERGFNEAASLPGDEFKLLLKLTAGHRTAQTAERNPNAEVLAKLAGGTRAGYYRQIKFTYDKSFDAREVALIKKAVSVVANRFLDPRMLTNTRQNYRTWHMASPYLSISGLTTKPDAAMFERWFAGTQLGAISSQGFTRLNIRRMNENSGVAGRAQIGIVQVKTTGGKVPAGGFYLHGSFPSISGEFVIQLNSYNLANQNNEPWYTNDANVWGGIIAHEMLHNLGHTHPNGNYDGSMFIDAYGNAVETNGNWRRGLSLYGRERPRGH